MRAKARLPRGTCRGTFSSAAGRVDRHMPRIAFVMDPLESLSLKKDSTLAMIRAAQARGWEIAYLNQGDLLFHDNRIQVFSRSLRLTEPFASSLDPAHARVLFGSRERLVPARRKPHGTRRELRCHPHAQGSALRHGVRLCHLPARAGRGSRRIRGQSAAVVTRLQREVLRNPVSAMLSAAGGEPS